MGVLCFGFTLKLKIIMKKSFLMIILLFSIFMAKAEEIKIKGNRVVEVENKNYTFTIDQYLLAENQSLSDVEYHPRIKLEGGNTQYSDYTLEMYVRNVIGCNRNHIEFKFPKNEVYIIDIQSDNYKKYQKEIEDSIYSYFNLKVEKSKIVEEVYLLKVDNKSILNNYESSNPYNAGMHTDDDVIKISSMNLENLAYSLNSYYDVNIENKIKSIKTYNMEIKLEKNIEDMHDVLKNYGLKFEIKSKSYTYYIVSR